jgi:RimJ/RimL family protein N-acetyltransferase
VPDRVRLAPLRDNDSDLLFAWINDRELVILSAPFRRIERAEHDAWFASIRQREDARIFGIRLVDGDELIGSCQLHSIHDGSAELQIRIGERNAQGRGYGSEAVRLLLRHAFWELGLRRVTLHVLASNTRALAVYRRAGFVEQVGSGGRAEIVEIDGRTERVIRMARPHVVAIHQPNFFPWLGFFDKLRRSDTFILLDTVEFSKGSRTNRVEVLVGGTPHWITAPVQRAGIGGPIRDVLIDETRPWRSKVVKTLRQNYRRADALALVEELVAHRDERLAGYNEHAIRRLAAVLTITTPIVRASDLAAEGRATELLIALVRAAGGSAYLAGGGAGGYQEDERFTAEGIEVLPQDFAAPHGLSVLHALLSAERPAAPR